MSLVIVRVGVEAKQHEREGRYENGGKESREKEEIQHIYTSYSYNTFSVTLVR